MFMDRGATRSFSIYGVCAQIWCLQVEELKAKLNELQITMGEQEATIVTLRVEVSKKNEQLTFVTDEKVGTTS